MHFVNYKIIDQKIGEIANSTQLNVLFYINPQNLNSEKEKFFEEIKLGNEYNPKFLYPSKNPIYSYFSMKPTFETYKSELKELLNELDSDCLGLLCENKILDLLESIELVKSIGTPNFTENSEQFYGSVDRSLIKSAKEQVSKKINISNSRKITFNEAQTSINNFFKKKKLKYKIKLRDSAGSMFSVHPSAGLLYINQDLQFNSETIKRLIAHEIETHIYRYENGLRQDYSILAQGTSKRMLETEEGLAVAIEGLKGLEVDAQLKTYAGRVLAISLAKRKSFFETFSALTEFFSDEESFILTTRAKRGSFKTSEPGAFTKDILYYQGKFLVEDFIKDHSVKELYYGKYSIDDLHLVKGIDGLKEPKYLPDLPKSLLK